MSRRNKGFTLIELLVVISIIALLIGILLPALGEAKRKARLLQDVANLGEHGKAIGIYAAQNRGRMPNIKGGNGGTGQTGTGYRSLPAFTWANGDEGQGTGGPSNGSSNAYNGFAFINGGLTYDDVWRFHHIAFGDYIVDGEGFDLLNDVFASPGTNTSANWDVIKEGTDPDLQFPLNFAALQSSGQGWYQGGQYGQTDQTGANGNDTIFTWALQSDYYYTFAALYGQRVGANTLAGGAAPTFWDPGTNSLGGGAQMPWEQSTTYTQWRSYIQVTAFDHPSDKVAFWEFWASESRRANIYFMPFAQVAVTTVDGSSKVVKPFDVMPDGHQSSLAYQRRSGWGTQQLFLPASGHGSAAAQQALGLNGPNPKPFAWFIYTDFGARGRDLAGAG